MEWLTAGLSLTSGVVAGGLVILLMTLYLSLGLHSRRVMHRQEPLSRRPNSGAPPSRSRRHASLIDDKNEKKCPANGYLGEAVLTPIGSAKTQGTVTFAVTAGALRIQAVVSGAAAGDHGLEIHSESRLQPPASQAAAGHFVAGSNSGETAKSRPHRLTNLGKIDVDRDGHGELTLYLHPAAYPVACLEGWRTLLGKTITLRVHDDDYQTDLDGKGGVLVARGIVERRADGLLH